MLILVLSLGLSMWWLSFYLDSMLEVLLSKASAITSLEARLELES